MNVNHGHYIRPAILELFLNLVGTAMLTILQQKLVRLIPISL